MINLSDWVLGGGAEIIWLTWVTKHWWSVAPVGLSPTSSSTTACVVLAFAHRLKPGRNFPKKQSTIPRKNKASQMGIGTPDEDPLCLGIWRVGGLGRPAFRSLPAYPNLLSITFTSVCSFTHRTARFLQQLAITHNYEQVTKIFQPFEEVQ